ncbi:MAG: HEPN domain-containing protein [Candidatus Hydrogenedentes bacterium]|nr:HEPN domain-containing protein [Candidatus Hydrogenedentota bacterium]
MANAPEELMSQADYDMESAEWMLSGGRLGYAIFACHLSIEKALKAIYHKRTGDVPPYTHNLIHLVKSIGLRPDENFLRVLTTLTQAQPVSRYPQGVNTSSAAFDREGVTDLIGQSKDLLQWIKKQY